MLRVYTILSLIVAIVISADGQFQHSFSGLSSVQDINKDNPFHLPRVDYRALGDDDGLSLSPEGLHLHCLHVSGGREDRVNLMFFSDGYTEEEEDKFVADATRLTNDIVSPSGAMSHVANLLNVWAAFIPSNESGIGTHNQPREGAAFGLYRPGAELRAVYVDKPKKARGACRFFRQTADEGGCDQAILLGNDALYGGLGGEFTITTASELNGPLVLRHELGHSLIPVGEEYEGGYAYFGANSDKIQHLGELKWHDLLSDPDNLKVEDAKVPLQVYPWHDLQASPYSITFNSSNGARAPNAYPTAMLRASLSSIPHASHVEIILNGNILDISASFPAEWAGSHDRRWLELPLSNGLDSTVNTIQVKLTDEARKAPAGQGGKMVTSLEIIEYGGHGRFNHTEGHIGAFPTYAMDGKISLRPTNEGCLMRKVNHPKFCPVCARALRESLEERIARRSSE
ncbi:hypothetical protein IAT40_004071 [Kwoniella sp. CBS 6097]